MIQYLDDSWLFYILQDSQQQRKCYVKSMYLCVNPVSLVPLAIEMYLRYEEMWPDQLEELFDYFHDDLEKVELSDKLGQEYIIHCCCTALTNTEPSCIPAGTWYTW